jgi:putative tryptophan/tyrosine transport system substrate-binding protein
MRRREFITIISSLAAWPLTARAQQLGMPVIGFLSGASAALNNDVLRAFREGLSRTGYAEGRNVAIEYRWADGENDRLPALAADLVLRRVNVIVAGASTPAALAAQAATPTIPIVFQVGSDPIAAGLVASLARPGGNITGFSNVAPDLSGKKQQLLKELVPKVSRLAVLWNPANPIEVMGLRDAQAAAAVVGLEILSIEVRAPEDFPAAFAAVTAGRADALHAIVNPVNSRNYQLIVDFALKNRLPSSFEEKSFVVAGGLFSYGSSFIDTYQRSAIYVDKILKGAKPAEMPIQQPTKFEFVINLKTAKALGLTVPQSLLLRADEVIQ